VAQAKKSCSAKETWRWDRSQSTVKHEAGFGRGAGAGNAESRSACRLGTDGAASNNDLNLWEEMDTAAKLHKVISRDPKVVNAARLFEMAYHSRRARAAFGKGNRIGGEREARRVVIVDLDDLKADALLQYLFRSRLRDQSRRRAHCNRRRTRHHA